MAEQNTETTPTPAATTSSEGSATQVDVNRVVQERLARERAKFEKELQSAGFASIDELKSFRAQQVQTQAEAEEAERQRLAEQQQYKSLYEQDKKQWTEREAEYQRQLAEHQTATEAARQQAHSAQVNRDLVAAANAAGAVAPDQVASLLSGRLSVNEDGKTVVLGEDGQPATDGRGNLLSIEQVVTSFLEGAPHFLRAAPAGAGSRPVSGVQAGADLKAALKSGDPQQILQHRAALESVLFGKG